MERIKYEEMTDDKRLVKVANDFRRMIEEKLPEGKTAYKLMGIKWRKDTYPTTTKTLSPFSKPEKTDSKTLSLEELSKNQIGFFGNMNNLSNIDGLKNIVDGYCVTVDGTVEGAFALLYPEKTKDSLGRIIIKKNCVLFRPYTAEEEAEYQAKLDEQEAKALGYGESSEISVSMADFFKI